MLDPACDTTGPQFADVLVPRRLDHPFTYRVPISLQGRLHIGSRVLVPFGPGTVEGVVVAFSDQPSRAPERKSSSRLRFREITRLIGDTGEALPRELLELTRMLAGRYVAPWGQCLRLVLPPPAPRRAGSRTLDREAEPLKKRSQRGTLAAGRSEMLSLDIPQQAAEAASPTVIQPGWDKLQAAMDGPHHATFLLHAPADDRMDSLIRAADLALTRQRSVLLIAAETARASAFFERAHRLWGSRVALWYGGLAPAARADLWRRIRSGSVAVVVGTRSAVFTPMTSLGLLCLDEEDNPSLKEEQAPRYHAREVARMRAQQAQAVLLLGSSHPAVETLGRSEVDRLPSLGAPTGRGSPPTIVTVDIRRQPYGTLLSEPMVAGIRAAIETRSGAVLFLNRKGFAPALQCRDCGQALQCRNCRVTLTFYRRAGRLTCHYCGASFPLPDACPACNAVRLDPSGFGTEQLEEEVRRLFHDALILRLDGDTARTPAQAETIRRETASGKVDVLIGTQMLFQGSPLPSAGFVGLPYADAGLHRPDFRAAERTYHALLDAVGLARSGEDGGTVILQTYLPTHHALAAVVNNNPAAFYEQELASRQALGYPPFAHLISLHISGKHEGRVKEAAHKWAALLAAVTARSKDARDSVTILGPIPAATARVRGRHRWQLLVKSTDGETAKQAIRSSLKSLEEGTRRGRGPSGIKFDVDVDPVEMW